LMKARWWLGMSFKNKTKVWLSFSISPSFMEWFFYSLSFLWYVHQLISNGAYIFATFWNKHNFTFTARPLIIYGRSIC
jgi:hypothetical protein